MSFSRTFGFGKALCLCITSFHAIKSVDENSYKWEFCGSSTYFTDEVYILWHLKYISYREGSSTS